MKSVASLFALFIAVCCTPALAGSEPISAYSGHWKVYTIADGLSGGLISSIIEDKSGVLWFTTGDGICRYDGEEFRNFSTVDGLPNHFVYAILEERAGNLWCATWGAGVCKYDGKRFGPILDSDDGLVNNFVVPMIEDTKGNLWFGTYGGVSKYDGERFENFTAQKGRPENYVTSILEDREGNLWFGTNDGNIYTYDGQNFQSFKLANNRVTAILEDRQGNLWFGTWDGLYRYDGEHFQPFTESDGLIHNEVTAILEDRQGNLWFGTHGGSSRYDGVTFQNLTTQDGLASNNVTAILEDREGNLWFGTWGNGICKYDDRVQTYFREGPIIGKYAIEDRVGNLWFSTNGAGVLKYDGKKFQHFSITDGLGGVDARIVEDSKGNLWFGGLGAMTRYNGVAFQRIKDVGLIETEVIPILEDQKGVLWLDVRKQGMTIKIGKYDGESFQYFGVDQTVSIVEDGLEDQAGVLWFGTTKSGVYKYSYNGNSFEHLTTADGLAGDRISSIVEDGSGNLWFGILDNDRPHPEFHRKGGLSVYNGVGFQTRSTEDGLGNDSVTFICKDRDGTLWFGTWHGGVSKYDGKSFQTFTTKDGLAGNTVLRILADLAGNLWLGTEGGGVNQYNGVNFQTLTTEEGLINNTAIPVLADSRGHIWFRYGSVPGLTRYTPSRRVRPRVEVTQVVADRIHTAPREVKLTSNVDHIAFHYKGLTLKTQFNQIRYIYQLEGYDTDWCPSTRKRIAQYNHLNPGTYVFKVKAIDRDLNDSEPASVTLKVVLPFYLRAGFLVPTVGGGAILLVILVIQAIILVKRRRQVLAYQQAAVHELRDAREMQLSLLPKNAPHIEGFDIASACEPATDVGGDYFTYLWLNEAKTQFGIVLMDVTGHGMKAATTTFLANGMLQAESRNKQSPCEIMAKMHQSLQDILPRRAFVATSFACINLRDKTLTHFNAALPEPILLRNGKPVELQIQSNPPLGSPFRAEYSGTTVPLRAGDVLLFFSDGLPDARDDLEQVYQEARLETLLDSLVAQPQPAQAWVDAILTDVHAFSGELEDDLTIVVVRVL